MSNFFLTALLLWCKTKRSNCNNSCFSHAKNTFCCITNKRVIKRSGAFNNDFKHYYLKNIGNVRVDGGIFDSKGDNPSANLVITVKDYHTNTDGNANPTYLVIESLDNVYDAYKMINKLIEGNNESFSKILVG